MGLLSSDISDKEFNKLASKAGYGRYSLGGSYSTAAEYETATNQARLWHTQPVIPGISKNELINKLNAETARQTPLYQQEYAINQQQSLLNDNRQQQALALGQRNAAVGDALNNAQRTAGPGQSTYDQRLQQMMNGTFAPDDPSYQWRVQQGMTNLGRSQAAKGMLGSGNMAAELLTYGQGMASQEYGAQFNRLLAASQNATAQYTNAYSVLNQMMQQQQGQQQQGNANQLAAQGWGQIAQGWGSQNLGIANADTSRYQATSNAASQAGQLALQRDQFNAQQTRLDNADRGSGDALMRGAGANSNNNNNNNNNNGGQLKASYDQTYDYQSPSLSGSFQNNVSSQLSSAMGYLNNNSTGNTTQFGNQSQGSSAPSPFTNDYGYEAVYGD